MSIRRIGRSDWLDFFDRTSALMVGKRADVEIDSMELGAQVLAHLLPLLGIVYDPKDDILEVVLEGLDHIVHAPREIYIDDPPFGTTSLAVTDIDGAMMIITLSDPPMLPASTRR